MQNVMEDCLTPETELLDNLPLGKLYPTVELEKQLRECATCEGDSHSFFSSHNHFVEEVSDKTGSVSSAVSLSVSTRSSAFLDVAKEQDQSLSPLNMTKEVKETSDPLAVSEEVKETSESLNKTDQVEETSADDLKTQNELNQSSESLTIPDEVKNGSECDTSVCEDDSQLSFYVASEKSFTRPEDVVRGPSISLQTPPTPSAPNPANFQRSSMSLNTLTPDTQVTMNLIETLKICKGPEMVEVCQYIRDHLQFLPNAELVIEELTRLAVKGKTEAQFTLGFLFQRGIACRIDFAKAYAWIRVASKRNHAEAWFELGQCHEYGRGTSTHGSKAINAYRKAAVLKHPGAMYKLGMALIRGELGQSKNIRDGLKWLKLSAKYATPLHPQGLYELAMLHEKGVNNFVWTDHVYLVELLTQAAALGHLESMFKLGEAYARGKYSLSIDPCLSFYYYSMAAEYHHTESIYALSLCYLKGVFTETFSFAASPELAFQWMQRGADLLFPDAMFALGYFYEEGIGCEQDLEKSNFWYSEFKLKSNAFQQRKSQDKMIELMRLGGQPTQPCPKLPSNVKKNKRQCTIL